MAKDSFFRESPEGLDESESEGRPFPFFFPPPPKWAGSFRRTGGADGRGCLGGRRVGRRGTRARLPPPWPRGDSLRVDARRVALPSRPAGREARRAAGGPRGAMSSTSSLSTLQRLVEQLKMEAGVERIRVSQAAAELQQYCMQNACKDALLVGVPAGSNPFREPRSCTLL